MSATATCTAPVNGHLPGSPAAANCPVHKKGAGQPVAAPVASVPVFAPRTQSIDPSDYTDPVLFCGCGQRMEIGEGEVSNHVTVDDGGEDVIDYDEDRDHVAVLADILEREDVCYECREASLEDGEGFDGLCGSCADKAESSGRWSEDD